MQLLKKLAGETAIYGLSSIIGRMLNYLLVPFYTRVLATEEYGIVSQYYALSGFLLVLLSYRMESAFFRFGTNITDRERAYSTAVRLVTITTVALLLVLIPFVPMLSRALGQPDHYEYLYMFMGILATDILCELPFARLRLEQRPIRFASIKLINIGLNIGLNLFFLVACPWLADQGQTWVHTVWSADLGIAYIFLSNLIAGAITWLLLWPEWSKARSPIDPEMVRKFMPYALPLVVVSLAGVVNEMLDRLIMPWLLTGSPLENQQALGIYAANYKVAVLISLFTQAYRYAAEPFFFKHTSGDDQASLSLQADTTKWFTIVLSGVMLLLMVCQEYIVRMIGADYREGQVIIPILLAANVLLGVYYNFSVWFRLRDRTALGARISVIAALITLFGLIVLVPKLGYIGAAWATLFCYLFLSVATWYTGRPHYAAPYQIGRMAFYFGLALGLSYAFIAFGKFHSPFHAWATRLCCLAGYAAAVWLMEKRQLAMVKR